MTYGDVDMTRVIWGEHARHVPAWMVVQDGGDTTVALAGSSMTPGGPNPLRYGSRQPHQLVVGEIIVRPHVVIETEALRGYGFGQFLTSMPPLNELIEDGQGRLIIGTAAQLAELVHRDRTGAWRT